MEYLIFFLITASAVGIILYFVIEDIKIKKQIQDRKKKYEQSHNKEKKEIE